MVTGLEKPKILCYGNIKELDNMMDRHFYRQLDLVSDEMTSRPKTIDELNEYIREGDFTYVIIPDEHYHTLEGTLRDCNVPVIEMLGDHWVHWAVERKKDYMRENGISHAIVSTERFLGPYQNFTNFHIVQYGFDSVIFSDKNQERDIDILVSGASDKNLGRKKGFQVYPVRNWLAEILPRIGKQEGLNVQVLDHPGYFPQNVVNYQEGYDNILNRAKIGAGGSSHWRLVLKKLYEIPASGAVLLTDLPMDDTDFFSGRVIEVDPERIGSPQHEDQIRRRVMEVLTNYDNAKGDLQPFRSSEDRFERSYAGRALEMRRKIFGINQQLNQEELLGSLPSRSTL